METTTPTSTALLVPVVYQLKASRSGATVRMFILGIMLSLHSITAYVRLWGVDVYIDVDAGNET